MELNSSNIRIQYQRVRELEDLKTLPALEPFDKNVCDFLNSLSAELLKNKRAKQFPDIVTFAFFVRKANIEALKNKYGLQNRLGKGLSFHIAPSNVPINFAYSLTAGLLAGNSCVVRASSKDFEQTEIICKSMQKVAEETKNPAASYIVVLTYERSREVTDMFSAMCDIRIIWGGDQSVQEIRKSPLPARASEITFADRYSICVIKAAEILETTNFQKIAQDFYNDTYLYDQNACSSPRLIYWLGDKAEVAQAKQIFWKAIHTYILPKYVIEPVIAVDKLMMDYRAAIDFDGIELEPEVDNLFHRIKMSELSKNVFEYSCPGGSFLEYDSTDFNALLQIDDKKLQTVSYFGCCGSSIADWVCRNGLAGIDRIVPMGKTAEFTLTWDGYDLIREMSRKIYWE